jgi:hypothetical protein
MSGKQVSPLGESSPEKLHNIVQDMGNETGNRALTISAGDFIKAMEQGGITLQEFQVHAPELFAKLQTLAPGESLPIPYTDLARNPEVMEHVLPDARNTNLES